MTSLPNCRSHDNKKGCSGCCIVPDVLLQFMWRRAYNDVGNKTCDEPQWLLIAVYNVCHAAFCHAAVCHAELCYAAVCHAELCHAALCMLYHAVKLFLGVATLVYTTATIQVLLSYMRLQIPLTPWGTTYKLSELWPATTKHCDLVYISV